jgi:beta-mannanase
MGAASAFARVAGKKVSLISWGSDFYSKQFCAGYCDFQTANFDAVRSYGAVPVFSWAPTFSTRKVDRKIATGSQDAYITQWAKAAKAWGHPFFLRFAWEMNGQWFPWGIGSNGLKNTPAEYRAMWRHVYNIFQRVGARNATWVWCPNWSSPPYTYTPVSNLWPGKSYVNWTCLDGYNADDPWLSFDRIYRSSYQTLMKIAPDKPVMFGELSSTERGGSKAQWIRNMFSLLPKRYPSVRAIIWFEGKFIGPGGRQDWVVESSRSSKRAFQAGIRERRYRSNVFSGLSGNPIRPPS